MQEFTIIDEKRYPLNMEKNDNNDLLPYYRLEHRVTIGYKGRRLTVVVDQKDQKVYIEETTSGIFEEIEDKLFEAAFRWATEKGFLNMLQPIWKYCGYNKMKIK